MKCDEMEVSNDFLFGGTGRQTELSGHFRNHSGGRGSSSAACTDGNGIPVSAGDTQCPHGCGGN